MVGISIVLAACDAVSLPQMINLPKFDLGLDLGGSKGISGSGDVVKETRTLRDIQEINLVGTGNLFITQGNTEGLQIEAEDNLIQYFKIEVNQGKLTLDTGSGTKISPTEPINFYINIKTLDAISLDGSGNVESESLKTDTFTINLAGSGNVKIPKFRAQSLVVKIPGSGDVRLGGKVLAEDINISGSGDCFTKALASTTAKINVGGSGTVEVLATDTLDVTIKGSGVVRYVGSPALTKNISGSGGIEKVKQ